MPNDAEPLIRANAIEALPGVACVEVRSELQFKDSADLTAFKAHLSLTSGDISGLTDALALKAPLASPALTGTPTAPTASAGTNTTQIATTAFVKTAIDNLVASAPGALDTLNEIAAALNNDASFAATMTTALAGKVPTTRTVNGHALSGNVTVTKSDVGLGNLTNDLQVKASDVAGTIDPGGVGGNVVAGSNAVVAFVNDTVGPIQDLIGDNYAELNDALTQKVPISRTVTGTASVSGGGELSGNITLNLTGDNIDPGPNKVYGTDSAGDRGWKNDPAGGVTLDARSGTLQGFATDTIAPTPAQFILTFSGPPGPEDGTLELLVDGVSHVITFGDLAADPAPDVAAYDTGSGPGAYAPETITANFVAYISGLSGFSYSQAGNDVTITSNTSGASSSLEVIRTGLASTVSNPSGVNGTDEIAPTGSVNEVELVAAVAAGSVLRIISAHVAGTLPTGAAQLAVKEGGTYTPAGVAITPDGPLHVVTPDDNGGDATPSQWLTALTEGQSLVAYRTDTTGLQAGALCRVEVLVAFCPA